MNAGMICQSRVLITAPTDAVITTDEAKAHLRVDHDNDDDLIDAMRDAVVGSIDPAGGGWLGRALRTQTWEYRLNGFLRYRIGQGLHRHPQAIEIPYPPMVDIASVKYDDQSGVEKTMVEDTDFRVLDGGVLGRSAIAPLFNQSWPVARWDVESVRIRFTAGYPIAAPAQDETPAVVDTLPPAIKAWIKLVLGSLYENRESAVVGLRAAAVDLPDHILQMLSTYRVYG